ncbi:tail completion protein gp17 [Caloramator sp. Dgby_cultured_2]|uniref:tail completion protein gp17 n=1 Tax=Caloramator sp. Dgby_cultured_2 TaxID=3029174 RepID=UPI00237EA837|nr:DUF3168 domain-containing protein [Caloramator sp. Dgby_cultured_2]WDU84209.1 DUF3168 domain-containing protein [Caloramator sp. Dgby_cultured_2]
MINIKTTIVNSLKSNSNLINLLGGQRIYFQVAPNPNEFPRITYFEIDNFGSLYADDEEKASEIHVQIDIWHKSNTTAIADEVDKTMKNIGFGRTSAADLYEEDTQVYHKALRYVINREVE